MKLRGVKRKTKYLLLGKFNSTFGKGKILLGKRRWVIENFLILKFLIF